MTPLNRSHASSYQSAIVTVALCCTIFKLLDDQLYNDLEILARGHSRLLKTVPFERLGTVSYSHSIAAMAISLAIPTQYMNVMDRLIPTHSMTAQAALMHSTVQQKRISC